MLISVVIPAYNVDKFIERAINSVLNQTYKNFEIIVVDDGSTDKTSAICEEYSKKEKRLKVIHQKNQGVSSARNTGIDHCKGEYICFLDSDDWFDFQYFDNVFSYLKTHKYSMLCNPIYYSKVKEKFTPQFFVKKEISFTKDKALLELFKGKLIMGGAVASFYRLEELKNIKFNTNVKVFEDILFKYNFIKNSIKPILYLPYIGYYYDNTRQSSATNSYSIKYKLDAFKVMNMIMAEEIEYRDLIMYKMYIPTKIDFALLEDTYTDRKDREICHQIKKEVLQHSLKLLMNPKLNVIYKRIIILLWFPTRIRTTYLKFRNKIHIKAFLSKMKIC